ncbi:amino acid permease 6-like isoform X2 [Gossypium australe]|uniref:Amino acid permease 6-like isoform X2 n=1 Tax=Gossypium australe TaxID=47621 RepID=A0A5B6W3W9_9ROSI|nr:amino acid permease 6-like isoform X2 [Gossypium australe]
MAREMQKNTMFIEQNTGDYENGDLQKNLDDDGREKRTGGRKVQLCGLAQYANLLGVTIGL